MYVRGVVFMYIFFVLDQRRGGRRQTVPSH
jgi:hypothetical protein